MDKSRKPDAVPAEHAAKQQRARLDTRISRAVVGRIPTLAGKEEPAPFARAVVNRVAEDGRTPLLDRINEREYRVVSDPDRVRIKIDRQVHAAELQQHEQKDLNRIQLLSSPERAKRRFYVQRKGGKLAPKTLVRATHLDDTNSGVAHAKGMREVNEDAHLAIQFEFSTGNTRHTAYVTAVFDGHGDRGKCSLFAAKKLPAVIKERLEYFNPAELTDVGVFNALKLAMVDVSRQYTGAGGTTANLCLRIEDELWVANTGDSRAILLDHRGTPLQISEDAKPTEKKYFRSIEKRGGQVVGKRVVGEHKGRRIHLAVARALGDHALAGAISARPKITKYVLPDKGKGCLLVQCCDGIFHVASTNEIGALINRLVEKQADLEQLAANLVASAFLGKSSDNLTALVTQL